MCFQGEIGIDDLDINILKQYIKIHSNMLIKRRLILFTELFCHGPVFSYNGVVHYSLFGLWSSLTNAVADAVAVVPFSPEVLIESVW